VWIRDHDAGNKRWFVQAVIPCPAWTSVRVIYGYCMRAATAGTFEHAKFIIGTNYAVHFCVSENRP
jgi:hypothetical protein